MSTAVPASEHAGLYVHIPFCSAICPYCDFAVQTGTAKTKSAFVNALLTEIKLWADWPHPIDTIYFGGGTPTSLGQIDLLSIVDAITTALPLIEGARWTIEANPEDVSPATAQQWCDLGFRTVSLGVQSFREDELRQLGRRHSADAALAAVNTCLCTGFDTVSVDLMFGLPNQTVSAWDENLRTVIDLSPQHISCYQLTVHEGTTFGRWRARGKLHEMPNENQADLFEQTHHTLAGHGWQAYEVSNFAVAETHRSAHNIKYWQHTPYLGLGPSAHSFAGRERWWNHRTLPAYAADVEQSVRPIAAREALDNDALALEAVMLRMRTTTGVDIARFTAQFGIDLVMENQSLLDTLIRDGLIELTDTVLRPTLAGLAVADGIASRLHLPHR